MSMRYFVKFYAILFLSATTAVANDHFECFPLSNVGSDEPLMCPRSPLSVGRWRLEAVTDVTAYAIKDGQRAYASQSMGGATFNATLNPLDCEGTIEINLLESGRSFILKEVTESIDETGTDHARLMGRTAVQPALNLMGDIELRASGRHAGILSLTVDGAAFVDVAKGGVVMSMDFADVQDDVHPYCDCRTHLRTYLDEQIAIYESILAGYENAELWERPIGLNDEIAYDYGNYNQFQLMTKKDRLSEDEIVQCFNTQYDISTNDTMTKDERANVDVGAFFKRAGRAGAETDPTTCIPDNVGNATGTCYPDIVNAIEAKHEDVHVKDCLDARMLLPRSYQHSTLFNYIEATKKENFGYPTVDSENTGPQALAETEIRAYQATLYVLRTWEEVNCGG